MKKWISIVALLFAINPLFAEVKLASPFADHMVLQQKRTVPVWGTAKPGEQVTVQIEGQQVSGTANDEGEWKVMLSALKAGGPFEMVIKGENAITINDVYVGEVWLCSGQSNMDMTVAREDRYWCGVFNEKEEVANAKYPKIRVFDTAFSPRDEAQKTVDGKWELVSPETVGHMSAAAYFFGRELYQKYKVPIGLITTAYGASTAEAWISNSALEAHPDLHWLIDNYIQKKANYHPTLEEMEKYQAAYEKYLVDAAKAKAEGKDELRSPKNHDPRVDQHNPSVLYNGMVAPLIPYGIRGAIWYQGESNGKSASQYGEIMEVLINDWRQRWGEGQFPFFYVQLANHGKLRTDPIKNDPMVLVREGQLQNLSIPNTGMAVAIDNADLENPGNIHPKNKQEIGRRLALIAKAKVYGEDVPYSGPIYDYCLINGNQIELHFKHVEGGLEARGGQLKGFAICGADKKFVHGNAKIEGNTIVVTSPEVADPVAVRYGWATNPDVNLYNKAGLPASPFRTDVNADKSKE